MNRYLFLLFFVLFSMNSKAGLIFQDFYMSVNFDRNNYKFSTPATFGTTGTFLILKNKKKPHSFSFSSLGHTYNHPKFKKKCLKLKSVLDRYGLGDLKIDLPKDTNTNQCTIKRTIKNKIVEITTLYWQNQQTLQFTGLSTRNSHDLKKEYKKLKEKIVLLEK